MALARAPSITPSSCGPCWASRGSTICWPAWVVCWRWVAAPPAPALPADAGAVDRHHVVELPIVDHAAAIGVDGEHVGEARPDHDVLQSVLLAGVNGLADRLVETGQ